MAQQKQTQKKLRKQKPLPSPEKLKRRQKRQKWIAFWIAAYFVSLFLPLISPYTKYPLYIVVCGGRLPLVGTKFAASNSYAAPGDETYRLTPFDYELFCTHEQAEQAGFHRR